MNFSNDDIQIKVKNTLKKVNQHVDIDHLEVAPETTRIKFEGVVSELDMFNKEQKQELTNILKENARVFRERPGRIQEYAHELRVTDDTTFFQKSSPVPLKYQQR